MNPYSMEPLMPGEEQNSEIINMATELVAKSNRLAGRLQPQVAVSIGNLVRSMNCYYSNLIEGHDTHPLDIDRALISDFSNDSKKRDLQLEAKAHIEVQRLIDFDEIPFSISANFFKKLHLEFCQRLPEKLLWVENPKTKEKIRVECGAFRKELVSVGQHVPPDAENLELFFNRFEKAYDLNKLHKIQQIIAVAASHHRFVWIHPFLDGNGRVVRLFSHAFLKQIGIGSSLWSVSRGLARNVGDYRDRLMDADSPRRGDLDGRGNLSAEGLKRFCLFFLNVCVDQVEYMESILEPTELSRHIELFVEKEQEKGRLPKGSFPLLREALLAGEVERGKAPAITGYKERQARTVLNSLIKKELLISDSPKGAVRLNFPITVVESWFPKLYPTRLTFPSP